MPRLSLKGKVRFMADKEEIRGYVPSELRRLLRAVVALKTDKDWNVSDALTEAVGDWLDKPENRELIKKHRLRDQNTERN